MPEIADLVLARDELVCLRRSDDAVEFIQLSFSLKESALKAISSTCEDDVDLRAIRVRIRATSFTADIPNVGGKITGQWKILAPFILSFAVWSPT